MIQVFKFWLFVSEPYEASLGLADLAGQFDILQEAIDAAESHEDDDGVMSIWDVELMRVVWNCREGVIYETCQHTGKTFVDENHQAIKCEKCGRVWQLQWWGLQGGGDK